MAKVKSMLTKVRATSKTYFNHSKDQIEEFQKLYAYLKKHGEKEIGQIGLLTAKNWLEKPNTDFVKKFKAMNAISTDIKH